MDPTRNEPLDDAETERTASERRRARGLRTAARRALALARRYRTEEAPGGERETACVRQALAWRASARLLRTERPGLARTSMADGATGTKRQTG